MEEQAKRLTKGILLATAGIILTIAFASWIWRAPNKQIPPELIGEWHTIDPSYSDRWFEINSVCITFVTGTGSASTGFIEEVKAVPEGNRTLYTISYSIDGTGNEVSFYYEAKKDEVIQFKHQKTIWIKDKRSEPS